MADIGMVTWRAIAMGFRLSMTAPDQICTVNIAVIQLRKK